MSSDLWSLASQLHRSTYVLLHIIIGRSRRNEFSDKSVPFSFVLFRSPVGSIVYYYLSRYAALLQANHRSAIRAFVLVDTGNTVDAFV